MLDYSQIEKYDPSGIHKVYDNWPQIAKKAYESDLGPIDFKDIDHIVFSGMGGSGAIGDMFASILSKTKIHVNVVKGYLLPKTVDSDTLVIVISVSGNTAEALSVLESAYKIGCKIIAFSSGGRMQEYCKKNKIEHRVVPQIHSPRASFTCYLYTMLKVLHLTLGIKQQDILESIMELQSLSKKINSSNLTNKNPALSLAEWISDIPVIYYPYGLQSAAIRFKNSLQENVKIHAFAEDVVEACHNGVVSWESKSNVKPILLQGVDDYIKTKERWNVLKKYFKENNIEFYEVLSNKGNILSKIIHMIYLLDYATIYLAILSKTDPSPVRSIEFIKNRI